ncbi:MAG: RNA polymerase sigma factor [Gemmatimonadota bacterium]
MRTATREPTGTSSFLTDRKLVQQVKAGSTEALGELYRRHAERIHAAAFRVTGSRAEAEEVLQDVFVGLRGALRRFDDRRPLEPWLSRLAARVALNRFRAGARRHRREREYAAARSHLGIEGAPARRTDARLDLERALGRLRDDLRIVLLLHEVEGYSHGEIGDLLEIPPGTSASRLYRALQWLREELKERTKEG